jgi:hypothetical protein
MVIGIPKFRALRGDNKVGCSWLQGLFILDQFFPVQGPLKPSSPHTFHSLPFYSRVPKSLVFWTQCPNSDLGNHGKGLGAVIVISY